eukprot:scaffold6421_cov251-Ochromonas_danica.AAC.6
MIVLIKDKVKGREGVVIDATTGSHSHRHLLVDHLTVTVTVTVSLIQQQKRADTHQPRSLTVLGVQGGRHFNLPLPSCNFRSNLGHCSEFIPWNPYTLITDWPTEVVPNSFHGINAWNDWNS